VTEYLLLPLPWPCQFFYGGILRLAESRRRRPLLPRGTFVWLCFLVPYAHFWISQFLLRTRGNLIRFFFKWVIRIQDAMSSYVLVRIMRKLPHRKTVHPEASLWWGTWTSRHESWALAYWPITTPSGKRKSWRLLRRSLFAVSPWSINIKRSLIKFLFCL